MAFTLAYQGPEGACSEQVVLEYGPRHSGSRTDPPSMTPLRRSTDRPRRPMCWVRVPGAGPILDRLVLKRVFRGATEDFDVWKEAGRAQARLIWEGKSSNAKLSDFAEEFFRRLATLVPDRPDCCSARTRFTA